MGVSAENGKAMLPGQCGDPHIVFWNRASKLSKFVASGRIEARGQAGDVKNLHLAFESGEPRLALDS